MEKNNNLQEEARKTSIKLLESIKNAIEAYNKLNPNDKIVLNFESQYHDVNNVFVCAYDSKFVGLFNRFKYRNTHKNYDNVFTYDYLIYKGINSSHIGLKQMSGILFVTNKYLVAGQSVSEEYVSDCEINNEIGFDDLRLKMYSEGLIGPYQIGKATDEEMLEVLKYASEYFGLTDAKQKIK